MSRKLFKFEISGIFEQFQRLGLYAFALDRVSCSILPSPCPRCGPFNFYLCLNLSYQFEITFMLSSLNRFY